MTISCNPAAAGFATLALFILSVPANAATVMTFPDDAELKDPIELQAYSFRSAPPLARQCIGQGGSGSVTITKPVDAMSPQLTANSQARKGSVVLIDDIKADGKRVAFQFTNAIINSIKPASGGDKAMESISFNFSKIQWITVGCKPPVATSRNGFPSMSNPSSVSNMNGY
jgi:type VI protein secretion system component Hcp